MKNKSIIVGDAIALGVAITFVVLILTFVGFAFAQSSIINKSPSNVILNTEYIKWATIDIKPSQGFHSKTPVRVRVDTVKSIAGFVTVITGLIDASAGYAAGVSIIHIDNIASNGIPKIGQTFTVKGTGKIYTVTAISSWSSPGDIDVTFTPTLGATVADNAVVLFRTYLCQINSDFGCYYDEREVHVVNGLLANLGWGSGTMPRYEMPPE